MAYAKVVEAEVKKIPGTVAVELSVEEGNPQLKVDIDRDRMAELGLNLQIVGATMQTAFSGNTNAKYRDGAYEYDINILLDDFDRSKLDDVANLGFTNLREEPSAWDNSPTSPRPPARRCWSGKTACFRDRPFPGNRTAYRYDR